MIIVMIIMIIISSSMFVYTVEGTNNVPCASTDSGAVGDTVTSRWLLDCAGADACQQTEGNELEPSVLFEQSDCWHDVALRWLRYLAISGVEYP